MNNNQFQTMFELFKDKITSSEKLVERLNISKKDIEESLRYLKNKGFIEGYTITDMGKTELDKHKVDNAIIMAAGLSSRFAPLSYENPKGLLEVKGERLIERQISQLKSSGIDEIVVVVGYKKEKFFYLEEKYGVKILINEEYQKRNNNSSLFIAKKYLKNSYICSSDNYFAENVFTPYVFDSYYSLVYQKGKTDEYCVKSDSSNLITNVKIGGENEWIMSGHVYFSQDFSKKFLKILLETYNDMGVDKLLWEDIYIKNIKDLKMYAKKYEDNIIYEFDTLDDLRKFDDKYINNSNSTVLQNICRALNCNEKEIINIIPVKKELTNLSFLFEVKGKKYTYHYLGHEREDVIKRVVEAEIQNKDKYKILEK